MLSFKGDYGTDVRPARKPDGRKLWAKDPSAAELHDGTRLDATLINDVVALMRALCTAYGVPLTEGDDDLLADAVAAAVDAGIDAIGIGQPNGVAQLDGSGKVPTAQLPVALLGSVSYQGTWNAATNTPALASGVGTKGYYYYVATAGSTELDGVSSWDVGDWAIFNGTVWQKVDNSESVLSVAGLTGAIGGAALKAALAIAAADITDASSNGRSLITAANYAAMKSLLAIAVGDVSGLQPALDAKAPLASPAFTGAPTAPTPAGADDSTKLATTEWVRDFVAGISSGVVTFNGRSGAVTSQSGDYSASQIGFTPAQGIAATSVQAAIEEVVTDLKGTASAAFDTLGELESGKVSTSRAVNTSGLAGGGGDLSTDRTIDVPVASQAEAEAGSSNAKAMTPLRTAQAIAALASSASALPPGFVSVRVSNNAIDAANDIDFSAGKCRDATDAYDLVLASALTKRLDAAWAVGTNQGGLDTGTKAADTWYYLWVIKRSDTGVVDALFSTSATSPTMPASYDRKQRVGVIRTDASGNIRAFKQSANDVNRFRLVTPILDVNVSNLGTSNTSCTVTVPPNAIACLRAYSAQGADPCQPAAVIVRPAWEADVVPGADGTSLAHTMQSFAELEVSVDGSSTLRVRAVQTTIIFRLSTIGWVFAAGIIP